VPPVTVTDEWEDCGSTCTQITSQPAGPSYTVGASDVGYAIEVWETGTGSDGATTVESNSTGIVPLANVDPATIGGTAQQGQTLTESGDTWNGTATTDAYQWQDCNSSNVCSNTGTNASTYPVTTADPVGDTIQVVVTATDNGSSATSTSAKTAAVIALAPVNTTVPKITGTAQEGQTLTLTPGVWSNTPTTVTDQWEDCTSSTSCSAILNATGTTYVVAASDAGHTIEVLETATNTGGTATASSAQTASIVAPPVDSIPPSITGTPQQGQTLTEVQGHWSNTPTGYTYQWYDCDDDATICTAIPNAIQSTYTPTATDVGYYVLVAETASNAGGPGVAANSPLTNAVTNLANTVPVPANQTPPKISGTAREGQTLTASPGSWTPIASSPGSYEYQWVRCHGSNCGSIPNATQSTYTLTGDDAGAMVGVQVTADDVGGQSVAALSPETGVVVATSTTTLILTPSPAVTNQSVTLVATVISGSGAVSPSGAVAFKSGGGVIGGCATEPIKPIGQSVTVTCQTTFAASTPSISAVYAPSSGSIVMGSSSPTSTVTVGRSRTSTSLNVSTEFDVGNYTDYTATVTPPTTSIGPIVPSGSVEFLDFGKPIAPCRRRPLTNGRATCRIKYKSVGTHSITVRYGGDSNFLSSHASAHRVKAVLTVLGIITSVTSWTANFSPNSTRFTQFVITGVTPGTNVFLTCNGRGCPFAKLTTAVTKLPRCASKGKHRCSSSRTINLLPNFRGAHLRVGAKITLSLGRCGWVGKYYTLTIRSGKPPRQVLTGLPVDLLRPGLRC
jgi:hypothetical protein